MLELIDRSHNLFVSPDLVFYLLISGLSHSRYSGVAITQKTQGNIKRGSRRKKRERKADTEGETRSVCNVGPLCWEAKEYERIAS